MGVWLTTADEQGRGRSEYPRAIRSGHGCVVSRSAAVSHLSGVTCVSRPMQDAGNGLVKRSDDFDDGLAGDGVGAPCVT